MPTLPSKKDVLLGLLERTSVLVHLDARRDDVQVPKNLKSNAQLILQLGLNLAVPIKDLDVTDEGVSCTLSFARTPFFCVLPYPAIFAMVSEDGGKAMVWPEDVPSEVARAAEAEARKLGLIKTESPSQPSLQSVPRKSRDEKIVAVAAPPPTTSSQSNPAEAKRAAKPKIARDANRDAGRGLNEAGRGLGEAGHAESNEEAPAKRGSRESRPKRELPPYLRVIK